MPQPSSNNESDTIFSSANEKPSIHSHHHQVTLCNQVYLDTIPMDILLRILVCISNDNLQTLSQLSKTSPRLASTIRTFRRQGITAIPLTFSREVIQPFRGLSINLLSNGDINIRKTQEPGNTFCVFDKDISTLTCYWQFRIDQFKGHRIDLGIATKDAFRFSTVERVASYSFDCFGRVNIAGSADTFGRQMRVGDVITLVYNPAKNLLMLVDNGKCMGCIPVQVNKVRPDGKKVGLYPFVYLPYQDGECVTLVNIKQDCLLDIEKLERTKLLWTRPSDLPYDSAVIVQTWCDKIWYAIYADTEKMTLKEFWDLLSRKHMLRTDLFELIWKGKRLERTEKKTLKDVGITIDANTGTCSSDVLLSVPHIIS